MGKEHIIAVLGMPGSGKTEAIEYLMKRYHLPKVYFGEITFIEMRKRGLEVNPENERNTREELRARFGKEYYANEVTKLIDEEESPIVLVESLYSWTEYQTLKRHYRDRLYTIVIHASPKVRYARLSVRPVRPLTKAEAMLRDVSQIEHLEQGGPIALADAVVVNEGTLLEMTTSLDAIIGTLGIVVPEKV